MRKRKLINKNINKLVAGHCQICKNDDINVLENHRIIPGAEDGKYTEWNTICLCGSCHNAIHRGSLKILGRFDSTAGRVILIEKNGKEIFIKETYS